MPTAQCIHYLIVSSLFSFCQYCWNGSKIRAVVGVDRFRSSFPKDGRGDITNGSHHVCNIELLLFLSDTALESTKTYDSPNANIGFMVLRIFGLGRFPKTQTKRLSEKPPTKKAKTRRPNDFGRIHYPFCKVKGHYCQTMRFAFFSVPNVRSSVTSKTRQTVIFVTGFRLQNSRHSMCHVAQIHMCMCIT